MEMETGFSRSRDSMDDVTIYASTGADSIDHADDVVGELMVSTDCCGTGPDNFNSSSNNNNNNNNIGLDTVSLGTTISDEQLAQILAERKVQLCVWDNITWETEERALSRVTLPISNRSFGCNQRCYELGRQLGVTSSFCWQLHDDNNGTMRIKKRFCGYANSGSIQDASCMVQAYWFRL